MPDCQECPECHRPLSVNEYEHGYCRACGWSIEYEDDMYEDDIYYDGE